MNISELIIQQLTAGNQNDEMFDLKQETFYQIVEDPKLRLYDPNKQEKFLELQKLIKINYQY